MFIRKKISKVCMVFVLLFLCIFQYTITDVHAADFTIRASSSSIEVGGSVTITVNVSGLKGRFDVSGAASDSFFVEGDSTTKSYTVTGSSVGTISATVTAITASDDNGNLVNDGKPLSKSVSVSVVAPAPNTGDNGEGDTPPPTQPTTPTPPKTPETPVEKKSSDANLSELSISTGELNPVFSSDVTNYSVTLGKDATSITLSAQANDGKARVSGTGEQSLKAGKNELSVTCSAEDGTTKTYIITVHVDESPDTFMQFNNQELGVVRNLEDITAPDGFEQVSVSFDDKEIAAWRNNLTNLTIIYMINEADEKNFYLYDEEKKVITSVYKPMALLGRNIALIDIPEELTEKKGMIFKEVEVDQQKLQGWVFENSAFENYALIYVMDDTGQARYYLYERSENTLQLYANGAAITQSDYEALLDNHDAQLQQRMWMIFALLATNIVMIALFIVMQMKRKKHKVASKVAVSRKPQHEDVNEVTHEMNTENNDEDTSLHITPYQNVVELFQEEQDVHDSDDFEQEK